jgi:hypothetical protein
MAGGAAEALVAEIAGHRASTQAERLMLETDALLAYFHHRRQLLEGALTASQVARLLGTSRQTPHDRLKSGSLLAVLDRGALRFPAWQFDPDGPDGVIAGLPDVLRALHTSPLSSLNWLVRPSPYFSGDSPLAVLKRGEVDRVVAAARAVEAD